MKIDLSNSEWKLMRRLWDHFPSTITELTAALREETGWSKNTVITMLSRLEAKGAVRCQEGGRAKLYYPALEEKLSVIFPPSSGKTLPGTRRRAFSPRSTAGVLG